MGYPCLSLHGGKDQSDRESTINDFKQDVCNLLVATSIAARGLDVKELVLVVNYDTPNHHEDYVHRVGRTGAAPHLSMLSVSACGRAGPSNPCCLQSLSPLPPHGLGGPHACNHNGHRVQWLKHRCRVSHCCTLEYVSCVQFFSMRFHVSASLLHAGMNEQVCTYACSFISIGA